AASKAYHEIFPEDELVSLVDYNSDVSTDSLKVARAFGKDLNGARLDTSRTLVDKYFLRDHHLLGTFDPRGGHPELVFALRRAVGEEGFTDVKIMVSGGFTEDRINRFEVLGVPVDMYGVGGSLLQINIGFTGDNVLLNGTPAAKEGRSYRPNLRL